MKTETSPILQPAQIEIRKQGYKQIYRVTGTTVWHSSALQANQHFATYGFISPTPSSHGIRLVGSKGKSL